MQKVQKLGDCEQSHFCDCRERMQKVQKGRVTQFPALACGPVPIALATSFACLQQHRINLVRLAGTMVHLAWRDRPNVAVLRQKREYWPQLVHPPEAVLRGAEAVAGR